MNLMEREMNKLMMIINKKALSRIPIMLKMTSRCNRSIRMRNRRMMETMITFSRDRWS